MPNRARNNWNNTANFSKYEKSSLDRREKKSAALAITENGLPLLIVKIPDPLEGVVLPIVGY